MIIKSKVNLYGSYIDFEFEGSISEIEELPKYVGQLKESLKKLASKQD